MKCILSAVAAAVIGLAAWGETDLAFEGSALTFKTSDATEGCAPWTVGETPSGVPALQSPQTVAVDEWGDSFGAYLYTTVKGAGTLTFKSRLSRTASQDWYWWPSFEMESDDDTIILSTAVDRVNDGKLLLTGDGEHTVSWYFRDQEPHDADEGEAVPGWTAWVWDVVWTPAPEVMTVAFDANGGTVADADTREYTPGETYGRDGDEKLPVPVRKGYTFLGWRLGAVTGDRVADTDKVAFEDNITLVAQWGRAVSALNTKHLTKFTSSGNDTWYAVDLGELGLGAELTVTGKTATYGVSSTVSTLQTTTATAGYLDFTWTLSAGRRPRDTDEDGWYSWGNSWIEVKVLLDGKEVASHEHWESDYLPKTTDARTEYIYIPAGKHTLKWVVEGCPGYLRREYETFDEETGFYASETSVTVGESPLARVWGISFEPEAAQSDLAAWGGKLKTYRSWKTGDLARFAAAYKTRMIADAADCEARLLYAATRLGALAENAQFKTYAKTFGFTVDWARLSVTPPEPTLNAKSAAVNAMADKTIALAEPVLKDVSAALAGIPDDWTGTVTFDAATWPLDESVTFDAADVQFARAGLDAALAGLYYIGAHDMTVNWTKTAAAVKLQTKIPSLKTLPALDDLSGWEASARNFRTVAVRDGDDPAADDDEDGDPPSSVVSSNGVGAMAIKGSILSLRLGYDFGDGWLNETNQIRDFDFYLKSGDFKLNIYGSLYGEAGPPATTGGFGGGSSGPCGPAVPAVYTNGVPYITATNVVCKVYESKTDGDWTVPATVVLRDGALLLNVNLAKVNLGTKKKPVGFAAKAWTVARGELTAGVWQTFENEDWFEPYEDEWGDWREPDLPQVYQDWKTTGTVSWQPQSDAERRVLKFLDDQTALFSKVRDAARLGASRRHFKAALERALAADAKAVARAEDGPLHFFEYDPADKATVDFARANTSRALAALDAPAAVDWAAVAAEFDATGVSKKLKLADFNFTLLPDEGMTRVYLGALFEGRISRALMPAMRVNAYGEIVPDFEGMRDPTIGGLVPDMTAEVLSKLSGRFAETRELDRGEWADAAALDALPKPGEKVTRTFADYKGWTASGLPKGWSWNAKTGVLTGTAASTFTVTFKKGKATAKETVQVGAKPTVLLFSDDEDAVAVTGTGLYNVGATVKAVAAVKAGFAFAGWYDAAGALAAAGAVYSFKVPRAGVTLTARTVPLTEDGLSVSAELRVETLELGEAYEEMVFNFSRWPSSANSATPVAVSASGLPPGLKIVTEQSLEDGRWPGYTTVVGTPTKKGVYDATFVAKNNGGFKWTHVVRFLVGGATVNETNTAKIDLASFDENRPIAGEPFEATADVPASAAGSAVKTVAAKGLPGGLKATFADGTLTIAGVPSAPGKFTATFTVTYANKKTAKTVKTLFVDDRGSVYIPAQVVANDPAGAVRGTVTGGGVKQYGQTLKFTAASANKKTLFFAGWYLDADLSRTADVAFPGVDYRAATLSAPLTEAWTAGDGLYARFVTKDEDDVRFDAETGFWRVEYDGDLNDGKGGYPSFEIGVESATKATLTAKGLPAGTKLAGTELVVSKAAALVPGVYTVTLTAKTASGRTATEQVTVEVANLTTALDQGVLSGLDTSDDGYSILDDAPMGFTVGFKQSFTLADMGVSVASGWTLAVTGLPKGLSYNAKTGVFSGVPLKAGNSTVTFTVSKKSGKTTTAYKATATFHVEAMPNDTAGTYVGPTVNCLTDGEKLTYVPGEDGLATVTVGSDGKVSATLVIAGAKSTFAANGLEWVEGDNGGGYYGATLTGKVGKSTVTLTCVISWHTYSSTGLFNEDRSPVNEDDYYSVGAMELRGTLPSGKVVVSGGGNAPGFAGFLYQNLWTHTQAAALALPTFAAGLAYTFDCEDGAVTLKFGANGKVTVAYTTANGVNTGSAQVVSLRHEPATVWEGDVFVALPPKTVKSGKKTVTVPGLYIVVPLTFTAPEAGAAIDTVTPTWKDEPWVPFAEW